MEALPDIVYHLDEPISDPAAINTYFASREFRKSAVIVALVGEGADELFLGYPNYHLYPPLMRFASGFGPLVSAARHLQSAIVGAMRLAGHDQHVDIVRRVLEGQPAFLSTETFSQWREMQEVFGPVLATQASRQRPGEVALLCQEMVPAWIKREPLSVISLMEIRNRMAEKLLMRVDKMSMAHSIEIRAPFLGVEFVRYAVSVDPKDEAREETPSAS